MRYLYAYLFVLHLRQRSRLGYLVAFGVAFARVTLRCVLCATVTFVGFCLFLCVCVYSFVPAIQSAAQESPTKVANVDE